MNTIDIQIHCSRVNISLQIQTYYNEKTDSIVFIPSSAHNPVYKENYDCPHSIVT